MTIGLCLSGGGFRATLFNLGSVWRLNEAGYLKRIARITSVSGGSITAGCLAAFWNELSFNNAGVATNFEQVIVAQLRSLCSRTLDRSSIILGTINPWSSTNAEVAKKYDKYLFLDRWLRDIPDAQAGTPEFLFYATSLQTGASVRITKKWLRDYRIGEYPEPDLRLAEVVACSSAFPPLLSPRVLKLDANRWLPLQGSDLFDDVDYRNRVYLTDGGVYDNMGMEAVWDHTSYDTVLISDAGAPEKPKTRPHGNWVSQYFRINGIIMQQARAVRKRWLIDRLERGERSGTYWGIGSRIGDFHLSDPLETDSDQTRSLQFLRTRLNAFSEKEQESLINWGYVLCDTALRRWVDGSLSRGTLPLPKRRPLSREE